MAKSLNPLKPRAILTNSEEEPSRAVPIRRAALIQMCEDGVNTVLSHSNVVTSGKMSG